MKDLLIVFLLMFSFIGCNSISDITCDKEICEFSLQGGTCTVVITSGKAWKASVSNDWITINPKRGNNKTEMEIKVSKGDKSEGFILISDGNKTMSIKIVRRNLYKGEINGHEWVDLGLPSGTKWASCNIGAKSPYDYGSYFSWAEIYEKSTYSWKTYKYGYAYNRIVKYCNSYYENLLFNPLCVDRANPDCLIKLEDCDDVAIFSWGCGWRIPTKEEAAELLNEEYCKWNYDTVFNNGYNIMDGWKVTSKINHESIFLLSCGGKDVQLSEFGGLDHSISAYWTSDLHLESCDRAKTLRCNRRQVGFCSRYVGLPVRPVINFNENR